MNYTISRQASRDIEQICDHIAEDNPAAADRLDGRVHRAIQMLAKFPGMGHTRSDVLDKQYLFWSIASYVIANRIDQDALRIVRVLHGARNFRQLFESAE
jgi:toxin ParE1/3/4